MLDLIRDAPLGHILHWASSGKLLPFPDERPDFVVPEKYRLDQEQVTGHAASDPTLVDSRSQSRSRKRDSLAASIPASERSGYPPTVETYNSRAIGGKAYQSRERLRSRESGGRDLERNGDFENGVGEELVRELSSSGTSMDTQTRKKREHEHWTKKMLKDPRVAKQEGLEDDYAYLVTWDGPDDPDNPQ